MYPQPPSGQEPVDPRGAFSPPPAPSQGSPAPGPMPGYGAPQPGGRGPGAGGPGMPPGAPFPYPYPPPMMPPPWMMPPGMMGRPPRSFARAIFTTLATVVFGLSLTLNAYMMIGLSGGLGLGGESKIVQSVLVEGDVKEKIAVIPVEGVILGGMADRFNAILGMVEKDRNVKALVLEVDTPGGMVTPSDEIYASIASFRKRTGKPVVVTMGSMATSGGYYVASAADYIFAQRTTITGSIGVIASRVNFAKLAKDYGVEESTLTAPREGFKNAGSYLKPVNPAENEYFQKLLDDALANFKNAITTGRGSRLLKPIDEVARGQAMTATEALKFGLIDQIGYPGEAYDHAATMAKIPTGSMHVVKYSKTTTLIDLLGRQAQHDASGANAVSAELQAGTMNLKVDSSLLDELNRPRLMYLWRGY